MMCVKLNAMAACHCTPSVVLTGFELIADGKTLFLLFFHERGEIYHPAAVELQLS